MGCENWFQCGPFIAEFFAKLLRRVVKLGVHGGVFDEYEGKDVVFWNTMIMGYAEERMTFEALDVFQKMEMGDVKPNEGTMLSLISVFMDTQNLKTGREIHGYVERDGFE
ncbi:hypothetical protein U1Q18_018582 [Sarracenia purpurea var. burkii]